MTWIVLKLPEMDRAGSKQWLVADLYEKCNQLLGSAERLGINRQNAYYFLK